MTELDNISLIVSELEDRATMMNSLIADIKSATESPYATDEIKVKRVRALIEDYGY